MRCRPEACVEERRADIELWTPYTPSACTEEGRLGKSLDRQALLLEVLADFPVQQNRFVCSLCLYKVLEVWPPSLAMLVN